MNHLVGQMGELKATITITRAATGKTEEYILTSKIPEEEAKKLGLLKKEQDNGSHS